jgi:Trypsin-like peptidase domain
LYDQGGGWQKPTTASSRAAEFAFDKRARHLSVARGKTILEKMRLAYLLIAALLTPVGSVHAQDPGDESLRLYAVEIGHPAQSWVRYAIDQAKTLFGKNPLGSEAGYGVYLGQGLVITAAHVVGSAQRTPPIVRIANLDLPGTAVKEGAFEQVDLTLLKVDEGRLPVSLRLRRMPLCQTPPRVGEAVIVAVPEGIARSTIMSPQLLPPNLRTKFPTVIKDVATTGNSGSGVFDADRRCLLGVMSRKIFNREKGIFGITREMDIAKYFVPAATIAAFIPGEYRK